MPVGEPFVILSSVDSTNKYAMQEVHDQLATHGTAYFALEQTAGQGQRGRHWDSAKGANILLSVVLRPDCLFPANPFPFTAAISLACYNFFKIYAGDETSLKWPNDLYWRDRKAGGLLLENSIRGTHWTASVVGMGININQTNFDPSLPNPVSLRQITGRQFDPLQMAKQLCSIIDQSWHQWRADPESSLHAYNHALYGKEKNHLFASATGEHFSARVKEVDEHGQLVLLSPEEKKFTFGSLRWLTP
jgi:BirA family biotin operon repressor/biotin-[acetyl-CoA-carboxylase] ligase